MSETTDKPKLGARAPLGLKRTVETGKVKQSFSHGRSNTVVVEVKKRRILGRPGEAEAPKPEPAPRPPRRAPPSRRPRPSPPRDRPTTPPPAASARRSCCARPRRRARRARGSPPPRGHAGQGADRRRAPPRRGESQGRGSASSAPRKRRSSAPTRSRPSPAPRRAARAGRARGRRRGRGERRRPGHARPKHGHAPAKRPEPARPTRGRDEHRRERGKLTVTRALDDEGDARARSLAALRRSARRRRGAHQQAGPQAKQVRDVVVPEAITVQELANRMAERGADLVKACSRWARRSPSPRRSTRTRPSC